jgi:tetratricopeptide (TPR) repeat protein
MRPVLFLLFLFNYTLCCNAQVSKIDSLSKLLLAEKADSNRVTQLWRLAEQYQTFKPDTALQLAHQALLLAQRIKFTEGESRSLALLATSQYRLGNYPKALNNYMLKLKIEEKRNSPRNYASALSNIGLMYILLEEYPNALRYLYRADSTVEAADRKTKEELKYNITINIGEAYYRMHQPDSAGLHFKKALALANQTGDQFALGASMLGEANVLALKGNNEEALQYYHPAFIYLNDGLNDEMLCEVTLGMAKVYEKLNLKDSAVFFGNLSFTMAKKDKFLSRQLDAANFLSDHFKKLKLYNSAFAYIEQTVALKDSIKGQEKTKEAMIISNNEQLRQVELAEQREREKEIRYQQLQLLVIAIFIPLFFLVTLFFSRIKIHVTIIKFMGIISLLLLFEYLTLFLHPAVADFTHHIPILELLIFVSLAAGLIPLHHRLEHLLIEKLTKGKHHHKAGNNFKPKTVKLKIKK